MTDRAAAWRDRGAYFSWQPRGADAPPVEIFHVEAGDPNKPVLVLVHGFPTSSIDWVAVVERLSERFRVCALDFPGYGFSDKPRHWGYSLARDAELLAHYVDDVLEADAVVIFAHDRGDSVSLLHAARCAEGRSAARIEHLILSNGNIYLPLSNLTTFQRLVLDRSTADRVVKGLTPALFAEGLGTNMYTPPRGSSDPEIAALTATFAHDDGIAVLHETIQYLVERSEKEAEWLTALAVSSVPTTVIWGLHDTVSPVRVAAFVWNEHLMSKPGRNALYFVPEANHYLQNDRPDAVVDAMLHALDSDDDTQPGPITAAPGAPVLVDRSRPRMPTAAEILQATDG